MFAHACRLGLEGIVSKRLDLPYAYHSNSHTVGPCFTKP
jgi:ATP-dependent DNA ligase